jgi:hypothetical protein
MVVSFRQMANGAVAEKHADDFGAAQTLTGRIRDAGGRRVHGAWQVLTDALGPVAAIASSAQHVQHEPGRRSGLHSFAQRVVADMQILDAYTTLAEFADNTKRSVQRDEGSLS